MDLLAYPLLSPYAQARYTKLRKRYGRPYRYRPKGSNLTWLARRLNMTKEQVLDQVIKEQDHLIKTRT